jgi:spore coat polysaccharide biosynthesis protein SpsF
MGSTRLPGKVLALIDGKPMIQHVYERACKITGVNDVVVATTTLAVDDVLVSALDNLCIKNYRGNAVDVLGRYYETAKRFNADVIIRITGDCPLLNPRVSKEVLDAFLNEYPQVDYASNVIDRTYPKGLDTEVFWFNTLERLHHEAEGRHREHVTLYLRENLGKFKARSVTSLCCQDLINLSVDTQDDLDRVRCIYESVVCY